MSSQPHDAPDSAIRVTVVPAQSAFFAGEPFVVTVTFTNTRTAVNASSKRTASTSTHAHKRAAHSISSVPLARPPTSPVTPRTAVPAPSTSSRVAGRETNKFERKGLIGLKFSSISDDAGDTVRGRKSLKSPAKSLSVTISPDELQNTLALASAASPSSSSPSAPNSASVASPLRDSGISPNHPHARKLSVLDGQVQAQLQLKEMSLSPPPLPYPTPQSTSASTSTFSLSLDTISENAPATFPPAPASSSSSLNTHTNSRQSNPKHPSHTHAHAQTHAYPPKPPPHRPTSLGLGIGLGPPPASSDAYRAPRTAFSSTFAQPGTELLLYSYAQLVGSLTLADAPPSSSYSSYSYSSSQTQVQAQAVNAVRAALLRKQVLGGGRMDITSSLESNSSLASAETSTSTSTSSSSNLGMGLSKAPSRRGRGQSHSRATSLSASILSLLSPSSTSVLPSQTNTQWSPGHKSRSPSLLSAMLSPSASSPASLYSSSSSKHAGLGRSIGLGFPGTGGGGGSGSAVEDVHPDTPLPTFDVQPSMLAVDLVLGPGESRSYTYTLPLPPNLPPTYRGKVMRFSYHLVVGVCRASSTSPSSLSPNPQATTITTSTITDTTTSNKRSGSTSQVMRVPIRIYNQVKVTGIQTPYDLLWPVLHPQGKGKPAKVVEMMGDIGTRKGRVVSSTPDSSALTNANAVISTSTYGNETNASPVRALRIYAQRLVASLPPPTEASLPLLSIDTDSNEGSQSREVHRFTPNDEARELPIPNINLDVDHVDRDMQSTGVGGGGGELTGCREAVEILTRNMRKVSYDVNKDGVKVAVLTFTKSAYRLGETVVGVVELNERASRARVLKLSATLEAHESLPGTLTPSSSSASANVTMKKLKRQHAEYHTSLTASTRRTSFALDIPSDAAPAFRCACAPPSIATARRSVRGGASMAGATKSPPQSQLQEPAESECGGLEWKVRLCLLVSVASEHARAGVGGIRVKHLLPAASGSGTEARGEWGSAWRATRGIAPLQNVDSRIGRRGIQSGRGVNVGGGVGGWASYFLGGLIGSGEREYHDGDEEDELDGSSDGRGLSPGPGPGSDLRSEAYEEEGEGEGTGTSTSTGGYFSETRTVRADPDVYGYAQRGLAVDEYGEVDIGGGESGWGELRVETVECEVPVSVWPGNTAFRPVEVVFDV